MNQNQRHTGPTGQKQPLTNAERQRRFRERRRLLGNPPPDVRTIDLFGGVAPVQAEPVTPAVTPVTSVTPVTVEVEVEDFHGKCSERLVAVRLCPFCGVVPRLLAVNHYVRMPESVWVVVCPGCSAEGPHPHDVPGIRAGQSIEVAVDLWNRRA